MSHKLTKASFIGILDDYIDQLTTHTVCENKMNSSLIALILQAEEYKNKLIKMGKDNESFTGSLCSEWIDICFDVGKSNENFSRLDFSNLNTGIICEYLKTICSDEQVATNALIEYISYNLKSLGNVCDIDPGCDEREEKAYYEVVSQIFQYFGVKNSYHKSILTCIAPISQYTSSMCMLKDGGRLIVHLREVCLRWITLSEMNNVLRSNYGLTSSEWRSLMSFKHYHIVPTRNALKPIRKSFYTAVDLYIKLLRDIPSTRADIPCCFWVYPDIIDQLLMGCCSDYERCAAISQIDFSIRDSLTPMLEAEGSSLSLLVEDEVFEASKTNCEESCRIRLNCFKKLISTLFKEKANIISKQIIDRVSQQLFSFICPSFSIHASRIAVLLLFGKKNLVTAVYKPEEIKGTPAQVAIVGDTVVLQVFSVWWIVPDETITDIVFKDKSFKQHLNPIAVVDATFKLAIHISDLLSFSCQYFPIVHVLLRPLANTNLIRKVVSRAKLAHNKPTIEIAKWMFENNLNLKRSNELDKNEIIEFDDSFSLD